MIIKPVERSTLEKAFKTFDEELRSTAEWVGWENSRAQRHAIEFGGQLYPPKQIIALATGMPVSTFSRSAQSNSYLRALHFTIVPLEPVAAKPIPRFQVGKKYDRRTDIHAPFGGSSQSGIAPSSVVDAIFLFTGESGSQYGYSDADGFDQYGSKVFSYTGEGQVGDMEFTRGNRAVLEHSKDGRALHLFRSLGKGKGQEYLGEFVYANHMLAQGPDREGNRRQLIIFHLVPVEMAGLMESAEILGEDGSEALPKTLAEARSLAVAAANAVGGNVGQSAIRTLYRRSRAVKDYVLMRANGTCESCKKPAPFVRLDGSAYLEPHHTTRLSDGGADHPRHVGAVCPACHREIHYGQQGAAKNAELQAFLMLAEEKE
jgi:5-methylcytosine-specific restriction protein A